MCFCAGRGKANEAAVTKASGEFTCRYYMESKITTSRLSDLLSVMGVPASFLGHEQARPDRNYALPHVLDPQTHLCSYLLSPVLKTHHSRFSVGKSFLFLHNSKTTVGST